MAEPISIQQLKDASEDAITLADFIYKPANVMIPRRLAADINSLQYYLDYMSSYAQHSYETYDEMVANAPNLSENVSIFVTNDLDTFNNGIYTYNGVSFVKGEYQPENAAKDYVEAKLGSLEVFDGKVRAQDVSTVDGSTQDVKNTEFRIELDALPFEDGVLADTFVTMTKKDGLGTVARTLRDINSHEYDLRDFGAVGDGVTDDTIPIKNAIIAAIKTGRPLFVPPTAFSYRYRTRELYFNFDEVSNNRCLTIYGKGESSCFKALDGEIYENWCQSFRFQPKTGVILDAILIKDIKIDNNARGSTPPPPENPYIYEQSATIALGVSAGAHVDSVTYDNVVINDPAGDGFNATSLGTIGTLRYINVIERNRTRVRASIQESFSAEKTIISNPLVNSIESESGRSPTNGSATVQINGGQVNILDIGASSEDDDVKYRVNNLIVNEFCNIGVLADLEVNGGQLVLSKNQSNFPYLKRAVFRDLILLHPYDETTGSMTSLYFLRRSTESSNSYIEFNNVEFRINYNGVLPIMPSTAMVSNMVGSAMADAYAKNHVLVIKNSTFDEKAYQSIAAHRMATVYLINNKYAGSYSAVSWTTASAGYATIMRIDGGDFTNVTGSALVFGGVPSPAHKLTLTGLWTGTNAHKFTLISGAISTFAPSIENSRVIESNAALPNIALSNDVYRQTIVTKSVGDILEHLCVSSSITTPVFVCKTQLGISSYETVELPTLPLSSKLSQALDTTTNTIKTWTGNTWV